MESRVNNENGIVLISTLFMLIMLLTLMGAYLTVTHIDTKTVQATKGTSSGFFTAEAGLNLRAEQIRSTFVDYNRPIGSSPAVSDACDVGNLGAGDFACQTFALGNHDAVTYVAEDPSNPIEITIPPGELYQNLSAQEYRYTVTSNSVNLEDKTNAILQLRFKSRLVPMFQFVAFFNKDLEILPGPTMNLSGPIHTNGDLYMNAGNALNVAGQVTAVGDIYRGRKNNSSCSSKQVTVVDPVSPLAMLPSCSTRTLVPPADHVPWNGMVQSEVDLITVPPPEELDPISGSSYWDLADLRLAVRYDGSDNPITSTAPSGVEILNANGTTNLAATASLNNSTLCPGGISGRAVGTTETFRNNREALDVKMLEVDMVALLNCVRASNVAGGGGEILNGRLLSDSTQGGLVFHMTHLGPNSAGASNAYGSRVRNASQLQSTIAGAPTTRGLTLVTDQAAYIAGHYNSINKIPSAVLTDSINILSSNWNFNDILSHNPDSDARLAANTTINVAVLSGSDTTGGVEGSGGQGLGNYNGGFENFPRFHERWSGRTLTYRGSFVSLNRPRHVDGAWVYGDPQYKAPNRDWDYDTDFNDASNLPPLSPRFVYLRQELFVRQYEQ